MNVLRFVLYSPAYVYPRTTEPALPLLREYPSATDAKTVRAVQTRSRECPHHTDSGSRSREHFARRTGDGSRITISSRTETADASGTASAEAHQTETGNSPSCTSSKTGHCSAAREKGTGNRSSCSRETGSHSETCPEESGKTSDEARKENENQEDKTRPQDEAEEKSSQEKNGQGRLASPARNQESQSEEDGQESSEALGQSEEENDETPGEGQERKEEIEREEARKISICCMLQLCTAPSFSSMNVIRQSVRQTSLTLIRVRDNSTARSPSMCFAKTDPIC